MDNNISLKDILETYEQITVKNVISDSIVMFLLFGKTFLFFAPIVNEPSSRPSIYLYNDDGCDFPHIMLRDERIEDSKNFPPGNYRFVCLYEHESIVYSLVSYEDKIYDAVDRLIELLSMTQVEIEREFPVLYAWLEAGGKYSHILAVDYGKRGCYECLFTDNEGQLVNNRALLNTNDIQDNLIIRNGCGGTRAAYGTTVLLRTTAALLDTIHKVLDGSITENTLINITPNNIHAELTKALEECIYDDYDRLIQLCDSIATAEGVVDICERMEDIKKRYGSYPQAKWNKNIELLEYFEEKTGRDIYQICRK